MEAMCHKICHMVQEGGKERARGGSGPQKADGGSDYDDHHRPAGYISDPVYPLSAGDPSGRQPVWLQWTFPGYL